MLRHRIGSPSVLVIALGIAGCVSEPPVEPQPPDGLSMVPLSSTIVTRASAWVNATTDQDSIRIVSFGDFPWVDSVNFGDVQVVCRSILDRPTEGLFVVDPTTEGWREIEGVLPQVAADCRGFGPCYISPVRFLSQVFGASPQKCLNAERTVRLAGQSAWGFSVRILEYDPSYDFATIRAQQNLGPNWLGFRNDTLWTVSSFKDITTGLRVDSLITFDLYGNRLVGARFNFPNPQVVAIGQSGLWLIPSENPRRVLCFNGTEEIVHDFVLPNSDYVPFAMTEAFGNLWLARPASYDRLLRLSEVDLPDSDSSGTQVLVREIQTSIADPRLVAWTGGGFIVATDSQILEVNSEGQVTGEFPLPVGNLESLAEGGGSIWITHHGPRGAYTDATLLTRFALE